jgi:hypothetical protein
VAQNTLTFFFNMQQIICTWNDYCKAKGKEVVSKKKKKKSLLRMVDEILDVGCPQTINPNH